jgi:hypothetical protein
MIVLLSICYLWVPFQAEAKSQRRCETKRTQCLAKCKRQIKKQAYNCRRDTLIKRNQCLKQAHKEGKNCLKKLNCPQATECYKLCRDQDNPVDCYAKKGCAKIQEACYASCQMPLGAQLKQCMTETDIKLKWCKEQQAVNLNNCQMRCPSCS